MPPELDEYEQKVIRAIEPDYDVMLLIIPSRAQVSDFAAAAAIASLKKRGLIKLEGRGNMKSCYLTDSGKEAYAALSAEPS